MMKGDIQHGLIGAAIGGLGGALAGGAIGKIKFSSYFKSFCFSYSSVLYLNMIGVGVHRYKVF